MKYSNKHNIDPIFVRAVMNDDYTKGAADFSVTEILKPHQIAVLEDRHDARPWCSQYKRENK